MRELRNGEREPVVTIPPVVRLVPVRVEPATIVFTVRVKQVRITIRNARHTTHVTAPRMLLRANLKAVSNPAS